MTNDALHMGLRGRGLVVRSGEARFLEAIRIAFPDLERAPGDGSAAITGEGLAFDFGTGVKSDLFIDSLGDPIAGARDFRLYQWRNSFLVGAGTRSFAQCHWDSHRVEVTVHPDDRENDWVVAHRLFFLPLLEWMRREGNYPLHAAGFEVAGTTVLVSGPSGSGKSTSSLAALAAGAPFLTDDTLFVSRGAEGSLVLNAFPEPVKIGAGSAQWFPQWADDFGERNGKLVLSEDRLPGGERLSNCRPGLLLFPRFSSDPVTRFEPMSRADAMVLLLPQSAIPSTADVLQSHIDLLGELVEASRPYRFHFAPDVPDLIGHIDRLLLRTEEKEGRSS